MSEVTKDKNSIEEAEKTNKTPTDIAELTAESGSRETTATDDTTLDDAVITEEELAISAAVSVDSTTLLAQPEKVEYKKRSGFKYGCYLFVKRTFDIVSSGLLFLVLSPLILILLLIKWLEDFHNPVYVSWRVGKDGKPFKIHKIRTMRVGAENEKAELEAQGLNEADGPVFKIKNDPRITKVGKIYRKLSLDELLQLIDIISGKMSVVGPRPPIQREVDKYEDWQKHRLDVKGGLLCLWQVQHNRNELSFNDWVNLDLEYIQKQSIWLDIKIIFKGAYMVIFDHTGE